MTDTKLNLSALKKDSPTSNIENEIVDLILEPEEIGIPDDVIKLSENQTARDEITLDMWLEEFQTDPILENDFISSPTLIEDTNQDINNQWEIASSILDNTTPIQGIDIVLQENNLQKVDTLKSPQEEPVILLEEDNLVEVTEAEIKEKINTWEESEKKSAEKVILGKKKKAMLSLSSIKSIPKTDAEKKAEVQKAEAQKHEDTVKRDRENRNITWTKHIETWKEWEEQELVSGDKKIVEEATKKIEKDIKAVDDTIANDKVQITLDKSLFDNYIPNYNGKKEAKVQKKEQSAQKKERKKRIRGPINKKKRNLLIVAMFLCILGAWGFVLYPHLQDSGDIKSDVVQITQDSVRKKVDLVLESDNQEEEEVIDEITKEPINTDENNKSEVVGEITETDEIENSADEENTEIINEQKDDKAKVKNYLLDNYYK